MITLITIFSQNMDEFEKQVPTLERAHPLISEYKQAGLKKKKLGCKRVVFSTSFLYLEIRGTTITRV